MRIKHATLKVVGEYINPAGEWVEWVGGMTGWVGVGRSTGDAWSAVAHSMEQVRGRADRRNLHIELRVVREDGKVAIAIPVDNAYDVSKILGSEWVMPDKQPNVEAIADLAESILEGGAGVKLDAREILTLLGRNVP